MSKLKHLRKQRIQLFLNSINYTNFYKIEPFIYINHDPIVYKIVDQLISSGKDIEYEKK